MYCVELHKTSHQIMALFYRLGLWHQGEEPTLRETRLKIFYSIYCLLFPVSLFAGSISSDDQDDSIFLVESALMASVLSLKLLYIIWGKEQILELLYQICVYSTDDREEFISVNDKLNSFMKFVYFLLVPTFIASSSLAVLVPFLGSEKKFFFNIGFPLDWKNNEIVYWIAFAFQSTEVFLESLAVLFSPIIWYLMINCALKYDVLGNQITKIGDLKIIETTGRPRKITRLEKEGKFLGDCIDAIQFHQRIREEIQQMASFLDPIFLVQLATSGVCICISVYNLVFGNSENLMEYVIFLIALFFNIFEIFMVMYFGNEIFLSSDRLIYCLFESNWTDQPESTKKRLIIFAELLKLPHVLVVGILYPLTLETFTRIMNSAYSMFNILKNFK